MWRPSPHDDAALAIAAEIAPADAGAEIRESIERHRTNLRRLAEDLGNLGVDRQEIDRQVIEIFRAYQCELARNIDRIRAHEAGRRDAGGASTSHPDFVEKSDAV